MLSESKKAEFIKRLQKRSDWLKKRIEKASQEGQDFTYDKAETSALDWAISELKAVHKL